MVAVGSRNLEKAKAFIQEVQSDAAKAYGSYEEVLEDSAVHGVYVPLPTSMHLEWVKKAAAKGKHILLEKPIATVSMQAHLEQLNVSFIWHTAILDKAWLCRPQKSRMRS